MSIGIVATGTYIPYYYMKRETIGKAWQSRGQKGNRSLANVDEDSITMAVEAAVDCFDVVKRKEIDALYFATTTSPFLEKTGAALISTACDLNKKIFSCDFAHSINSGANALKAAYDAVKSGNSSQTLVCAADCRLSYPKSDQEQFFGDAAAAVVVGSKNILATIDHFTSISLEIVDVWRNDRQAFTNVGEDRFVEENGYISAMTAVVNSLLQESGTAVQDIKKLVLSTPNMKLASRVAKKTGFSLEQLQDDMMLTVGDCGSAQAILLLNAALSELKPGEKAIVASYGSGANAFLLTATEQIEELYKKTKINKYISSREEFTSYARFLSFKEIASAKPGSPFKLPASASMTWREQELNLRFYASCCKKCGAGIFPINRVCHNCGSKDEYIKVRSSDKVTKVYTYSIDKYAGRSDDPTLVQTVSEDDNGVRYYTIMTDFRQDEVKVNMQVEFTFRKMHNLGNFNNYYWKCRPTRK